MRALMLALLLGGAPGTVCAQVADGGLPGHFLDLGFGARALGMGRAHVAVVDDAGAVYWNPAGLGRLRRSQLQMMHVELFENTRYDTISYAHPFGEAGNIGAGLAFAQLDSGGFVGRDAANRVVGSFSDQTNAILVGLGGGTPGHDVAVGLTLKVLQKKLADHNSQGYGIDVGGQVRPLAFWDWSGLDDIKMGFHVGNLLAPRMARERLVDESPRIVRAGLSYDWTDEIRDKADVGHRLTFAGDVEKKITRAPRIHAGAEYCFRGLFSIRAGYDGGRYTTGGGILWGGVGLDYAFSSHEILGLSHRVALSVGFGKKISRGW